MANLKIKFNDKGFKQSLKKLNKDIERRILQAITKSVLLLQGDMKQSISNRSSGRAYKRRTGIHIASKEREAPNTDTGRLINSILQSVNKAQLSGKVYVKELVDYAKWLEYGTKKKMVKRPFFRPAIARQKEKIRQMIRQAVIKSINS